MVSYINSMYRQQPAPNVPYNNNHMHHGWYPGYPQGGQMNVHPGYLQQDDAQMWHHQHGHAMQNPGIRYDGHNVFPDFAHAGIPAVQHHPEGEHQLIPSPPITVSGSEMSSPGGQNGTVSPPQQLVNNVRPPPARSPYEWIKKTGYQSQPTPGKTRTKDKYRVVYTDHQRIELEKEFTFVNKYITIRRKSELASSLGLSERQVKIWFQNRRAKERKQHKKRAEEKNQIEMFNNNMQGTMLPQHSQSPNGVVFQSQVPPVVQSPSLMQRYMQEQAMKIEANSGGEQMG